jgi:methylenetetrahydrofolate dehydrogenase (NADP+)/methenyltetrahydrofolate cyclohydrolase
MLKGKKIAQSIEKQLKEKIKQKHLQPGLAVILIGQNPASKIYVSLKEKAAQRIGIKVKKILLPGKTSFKRVVDLIEKLNQDKKTHGIVIQLPLPSHLNSKKIISCLSPEKDVDGFLKNSKFISPVHQAILELIKQSKKNLKNKSGLILSKKNSIFAQNLEKLLEAKKIKTKNLAIKNNLPQKEIKKADLLITILGQPEIIKPEMVNKKAVLIDVGYSQRKGKSFGDLDKKIYQKIETVSPVPDGIGPLTVVYLLKNVVKAAEKIKNN